ncbi:MAG: glutamyl-tRNA reductase [Chitinophagaceae bacterium]|nr:MAG: glutamyl-tRNA reductase [Chitinophagaceae bacterium]
MSLPEHHIAKQMLDRFCVVGVNYNKADVSTRGAFTVNNEAYIRICQLAKSMDIRSVFVVSTCNRTEIYGFVDKADKLIDLLTETTHGSRNDLTQFGYIKNSLDALEHLFHVSAGLDSQILGDYEILGQIKRAVEFSKEQGLIGPIMDRVINFVLQSSKKIKTETSLSNGTVSVSFAAIELLQQVKDIDFKKIVLLGTGKFGVNICKNLNTYFNVQHLFVTNRTDASARCLAAQSGANFIRYQDRFIHLADADIIIVCTNATEYTILPNTFQHKKNQLILDLSVPANVHPDFKMDNNVKLIDVDEISTKILDKTIAARRAEVPKAEAIIQFYIQDYIQWLSDYRYSLHIKNWREKLFEIDLGQVMMCEMAKEAIQFETEKRAKKAVKQLAVNLKNKSDKGCQFINSINDFLQTSS